MTVHTPFARLRLGSLAIQTGLAFALAMIVVGTIGFGLADHWVSTRIDRSLTRHTVKYIRDAEMRPNEDALIAGRIVEWQTRKVMSERSYQLFDRDGRKLAGRLDIGPPPPGFSEVRFTGGGRHFQKGRALATRLHSGGLFVIVQHSEAAESLHAMLPIAVLAISLVAIVMGVSTTLLFAHLTAKRLSETQNTAAAIAEGDLSRRIPTDRLDGMFAVQAQSLNSMIDHMEHLVRSQQLFSSNLAHDLRTPLARLQGLVSRASRDDPQAMPMLLERAERECGAIIAIFDALLRLAEIETGQHPSAMKLMRLAPLIEDVADMMEPVIADRGGALQMGTMQDLAIVGDPDLIIQLVINLLENVASHTPAGTKAWVSVERHGADAAIIVRDNGPGLASDEIARVKQPFERGEGSSSRRGSGLGLAIANAIARFHHGQLDLVDAKPGLEVRVTVPACDRASVAHDEERVLQPA